MTKRMINERSQAAAVLLLLVVLLDPYVSLTVGASKGLDRHLLRIAGDQPDTDIAAAPAPPPAAAATAAATDVPAPAAPAALAATSVAADVDTGVAAATHGSKSHVCRAGWYSFDGLRPKCLRCPVGEVSIAPGSTACTPCPEGFTTRGKGSTTCDYCKPGYAGDDCEVCDVGTWSRGGRASYKLRCVPCRTGFTTAEDGATSAAACNRCKPTYGYYRKGHKVYCNKCVNGYYSAGEFETCKKCNCAAKVCNTVTCDPEDGTCNPAVPVTDGTQCTSDDGAGKCDDGACVVPAQPTPP